MAIAITGSPTQDTLTASGSGDSVYGLAGNDILYGSDTLDGAGFSVLMNGGDGNDHIFVTGDANTVWGGNGQDTISFDVPDYAGSSKDNATIIKDFTPGDAGDRLDFSNLLSNAVVLHAYDGTNPFRPDGLMHLRQDGVDTIIDWGGPGNYIPMVVLANVVSSNLTATNLGFDPAGGSAAPVNASGTGFSETLTGNTGNDSLYGLGGADTLLGLAGDDRLDGGDGADALDGGAGNDLLLGGLGDDTLTAASGRDTLIGGDGNDFITAAASASILGGGGADVITLILGGAGLIVTADAGDGDDYVTLIDGAESQVTILGGNGSDTIDSADSTGSGSAFIAGGLGDDLFIAGSEASTFYFSIGDGNDRLEAFVSGRDHLVFDSRLALADIGQNVAVSDGDSGLLLTYGSSSLFLVGLDSLKAGDLLIDARPGPETIAGTLGPDSLVGSNVDTTFIVNHAGDTVQDVDNGGLDTVVASVSFVLPAYVENLTLAAGTGNLVGTGNALNNLITGNDGANLLSGSDGDDTLDGGDGNDTLLGGAGNDTLIGGAGVDSLDGGDGNDYLVDTAGNNTLIGGLGNDTLVAAGNAVLRGGAGADVLQLTVAGSNLTVEVDGGDGDDSITSVGLLAGHATLAGGAGNDTIQIGGAGSDYLIVGGQGDDFLIAGPGAETFSFKLGDGADRIQGFVAGQDGLHFESLVALDDIQRTVATIGGLTGLKVAYSANDYVFLVGVNSLADSAISFDPRPAPETIAGTNGADALVGSNANTTFIVNHAGDTVQDVRNGGLDTVVASVSFVLPAYVENLTLAAGTGNLVGTGNALNNLITGNDGANLLSGSDGDDTLDGGDGNDTLLGGAGNDTLIGGAGVDSLDGGDGNDYLVDTAGNNTLIGGLGNDTLVAAGNAVLRGGAGADVLQLTVAGSNLTVDVDGGDGDDSITSVGLLAGHATLAGGAGNDTIQIGGAGSDYLIVGGQGDDFLIAGPGAETFSFKLGDGADRIQGFVAGQDGLHFESLVALDDIQRTVATIGGLTGLKVAYSANDYVFLVGVNSLADSAISFDPRPAPETIAGTNGADALVGSNANTTFIVNHAGDTVQDVRNGGLDTVIASVSFVLPAYVENLTLAAGTGNLVGTGNALNNLITGNDGANLLSGSDGDDTLDGGDGNDTLLGGAGNDTLIGGAGTDVALFQSLRSNYTIASDGAGGFVVSAKSGFDGTDRLIGMEVLRFNDKDISLSKLDLSTGEEKTDPPPAPPPAPTAHILAGDLSQYRVGYSGDGTVVVSGPVGTQTFTDGLKLQFGSAAPMSASQLVAAGQTEELMSVVSGGTSAKVLPDRYSGPVAYLQYQLLGSSQTDVATGTSKSDFFNLLGGDDAANGGAGDDVIDGGTGSNFLTGGAGHDVFFLDGRGGTTTWATITDWEAGEQLSVWGWRPGISKSSWLDSAGAPGYTGVTMHADLNGDGVIDTSVTWSGMTLAQLPVPKAFDGLLWFT